MLNTETQKTYSEELLEQLELYLASLFKSRKANQANIDVSIDFNSHYTISSIQLTVVLFNEYCCKCILFDTAVTLTSISEVVRSIRSNPYVVSQMQDCILEKRSDIFYQLLYQCLFLVQNMDDVLAKSVLLFSKCRVGYSALICR